MTLVLAVSMLLLLLLGAPLFVALGGLTLGLLFAAGLDWALIGVEMSRMLSSPNLVVIPLFACAGVLMAKSGMPERFVNLAQALIGWIPGAAALTVLVSFEFFTAFTGASGVSILAAGSMLYGIMRGAGYSDRFSLGLIGSAGSLGVLLPPSIVVIFYGTLTRTPIDALFRAALLPGAVMGLLLGGWCIFRGYAHVERTPLRWRAVIEAFSAARYEIPLPVVVLGGIYSGWITINEAATLTAIYLLVVEGLLYRDIPSWSMLADIIVEAMQIVGAIVVLLAVSLGLTNYMVDQGFPDLLRGLFVDHVHSRVEFLLMLNAILLMAGCFLDVFSALILLVPLLTPIAMAYGVDPLHLGIIFLANLEVGYSTPPVGLNLFVSSLNFGRPLGEIIRAVVPFVLLLILSVLIITFVPELSTWAAPPPVEEFIFE